MRERVQRAFELQRRRWSASLLNGQVPHERVVREGEVEREARRELEREAERRRLSARALGRVLRIARTVADLEECRAVTRRHIGEALGLRSLDG